MHAENDPTRPLIPFSQRRFNTLGSPITYLMQQGIENPHVISLAAGFVDADSLPVEEVRDATQKLLADPQSARAALQYGTTAGYERLRGQLLNHFCTLEKSRPDEIGIHTDQLILTTGSQQFLSLVCEILLERDDVCLVAGPTYFVFLESLRSIGAEAVNIPADDDGMRTDLLEQTLAKLEADGLLEKVKLIYLVSYYENPSGISLSAERRRNVVDIARRWSKQHRILVLEDAAYRELRYDGPELPSVFSFDDQRDTVVYTQTFSKTFSPGIRIGYGLAPADIIAAVADAKGSRDFGSPNFNQHLLSRLLEIGRYGPHVELVRRAYRAKRDAMLKAADLYFSKLPGVSWVKPHGGLYVWMSVPEYIETGFDGELFRTAVQQGVMYVPGELCYAGPIEDRPRHEMRLSFGVESPENIDLGMQRLSQAVAQLL